MSGAERRRGERGIALIIVLLVVTLLTILVIEFTYSVQVESHISRNSLNALQATYLARSGINILAGALSDDEDNPAGLDPAEEDGWRYFALGGCANILENDDWLPPTWKLCGRIIDESGKVNVNFSRPATRSTANAPPPECNPANPSTLNYCWTEVLVRLAAPYGVEEGLAEEINDYWVSAAPAPALGQAAQPYAPPFGSFEDVAAAFPLLRDRSLFDQLRRYVTALPTGQSTGQSQVNINTAPLPVLTAILDDESLAQDIVARRQEAPFKNAGEALQGVQSLVVRRMLGTRSSLFRLEAVAVVNGVGKTVRALVQRDRGPGGPASPSGVTWRLTYLDWQKESGMKAALEAAADSGVEPEGLEGGDNSGNSES